MSLESHIVINLLNTIDKTSKWEYGELGHRENLFAFYLDRNQLEVCYEYLEHLDYEYICESIKDIFSIKDNGIVNYGSYEEFSNFRTNSFKYINENLGIDIKESNYYNRLPKLSTREQGLMLFFLPSFSFYQQRFLWGFEYFGTGCYPRSLYSPGFQDKEKLFNETLKSLTNTKLKEIYRGHFSYIATVSIITYYRKYFYLEELSNYLIENHETIQKIHKVIRDYRPEFLNFYYNDIISESIQIIEQYEPNNKLKVLYDYVIKPDLTTPYSPMRMYSLNGLNNLLKYRVIDDEKFHSLSQKFEKTRNHKSFIKFEKYEREINNVIQGGDDEIKFDRSIEIDFKTEEHQKRVKQFLKSIYEDSLISEKEEYFFRNSLPDENGLLSASCDYLIKKYESLMKGKKVIFFNDLEVIVNVFRYLTLNFRTHQKHDFNRLNAIYGDYETFDKSFRLYWFETPILHYFLKETPFKLHPKHFFVPEDYDSISEEDEYLSFSYLESIQEELHSRIFKMVEGFTDVLLNLYDREYRRTNVEKIYSSLKNQSSSRWLFKWNTDEKIKRDIIQNTSDWIKDDEVTISIPPIDFNISDSNGRKWLNLEEINQVLEEYLNYHIDIIKHEITLLLQTSSGVDYFGEKWKSEYNLFTKVRKEFSDYLVLRHKKLSWLGNQHIDIYIEELSIGIEYQGEQHFRPVEFFGGDISFKETQIRDDKKRLLCEENGVKLFYCNYFDDPEEIIMKIREHI